MRMLSSLACCCALAACAQDGDLLYVRTADAQPDDPGYGRLLSVFASSGDRTEEAQDTQLQIRVSGGTLRSVTAVEPTAEICVVVKKADLHEEQIAVVPTSSEALILAVLRDQNDAGCIGTERAHIMVPVQRVGEQPASGSAAPTGAYVTEEVAP